MKTPEVHLKSARIPVNGYSIHTRIAIDLAPQEAETIVLVHGLSVSSGYMVPTAKQLAPYYRVYAPDLPGYGKSTRPKHILKVSELADALAAWMRAMELPASTLLGNSLGCQIIADFAPRYPELIKRAIFVGPTMDPRARTIHQEAFRLFLDMFCEPVSFYPVLVGEYSEAGLRRTIRTLRSAFQDRMEQRLPHVQVPTLVMRGEKDPIVPQRWLEEVQRLLPDSRLVVIPGAGHAVNFNSPEQLAEVTRKFMAGEL
jgi:2-hydroxy-6-oxonona-2,4-dienedioate hydrolase